mgnify:CR=1 FL=1
MRGFQADTDAVWSSVVSYSIRCGAWRAGSSIWPMPQADREPDEPDLLEALSQRRQAAEPQAANGGEAESTDADSRGRRAH